MKKKILGIFLFIGLFVMFNSCSTGAFANIDVSGKIHYTGNTITEITFKATGGSGHYKIYYVQTTTDDWDYAKQNRGYLGTCSENQEMSIEPADGSTVSAGWYYYLWVIDDNGASGSTRWHI